MVPALLSAALLGACADSNGADDAVECNAPAIVSLAVGQHAIVDPTATAGCVLLPATTDSAEYLIVGYSAHGDETPDGVSARYDLTLIPGGNSAVRSSAWTESSHSPESFHAHLRARERSAASAPGAFAAWLRAPHRRVPPLEGSERTFKVCASRACEAHVDVIASAAYVGTHTAIYLDTSVPGGGYSAAEIDSLGQLFDSQLYPIDTTAFGRESDIDNNGVVAILLSDQVNALSPDCAMNGQMVPGYFSGEDLLAGPNSNGGEVFFAIVPDPAVPLCFSKANVQRFTGPTLVHEFQHMISYNRHVLLSGGAAEDTWLNEGLSLLAEELAGRQVASGFCINGNCLNQYAAANLRNAAQYLQSPVSTYLVEPGNSAGTLAERGANWLFVRWLADQSLPDSLLGGTITRSLLGADQAQGIALTGSANVVAAVMPVQTDLADDGFARLLGSWHLANYAESRAGFSDPTGMLRYRSWNLRGSIDAVQPGPYPLVPFLVPASGIARSGTLRGGSGDYLRLLRDAGDPAIEISFAVANSAVVQPRLALLRLR